MTKAELRAHIVKQKNRFFQSLEKQAEGGSASFQALEKMSAAVLEKFQTLELFQQAQAVGAYMPLPDEVDITPFFQGLESNGAAPQRYFVPAFDDTIGSYRMAQYTPELKKGKFGIPEPADPVWAGPDELDLILVPGLAFDRAGNRLGRGRGFYDRILPLYTALRAGICFDFQYLDPECSGTHRFLHGLKTIPSEPHDCTMDFLVTESRILEFAMNS